MKKLTREDAIRIISSVVTVDDSLWENQFDNDDDFDSPIPSVQEVLALIGITKQEYDTAMK